MEDKNLFDIGEQIKTNIHFPQTEFIESIELNENTLKLLKKQGIYGFRGYENCGLVDIPIIINNYLPDMYIKTNKVNKKCEPLFMKGE